MYEPYARKLEPDTSTLTTPHGHLPTPSQHCGYSTLPTLRLLHPPKIISRSFLAIPSGSCQQGQAFTVAQDCYDAIAKLGFDFGGSSSSSVKNQVRGREGEERKEDTYE
jgi:hypothetical protein